MDIIFALFHILGSLITVLIVFLAIGEFAKWDYERNKKLEREELSLALNLKIDEIFLNKNMPRVIEYSTIKFSDELLRNRLSDFIGIIRSLFDWIGFLLMPIVFLAVIWFTVIENTDHAVFSWAVIGVAIFFFILTMLLSSICKLITGRFPGEAKAQRESLMSYTGAGNLGAK